MQELPVQELHNEKKTELFKDFRSIYLFMLLVWMYMLFWLLWFSLFVQAICIYKYDGIDAELTKKKIRDTTKNMQQINSRIGMVAGCAQRIKLHLPASTCICICICICMGNLHEWYAFPRGSEILRFCWRKPTFPNLRTTPILHFRLFFQFFAYLKKLPPPPFQKKQKIRISDCLKNAPPRRSLWACFFDHQPRRSHGN